MYIYIIITIEILYSRSKFLYINIKYKYVYKEIYSKKLAHTVMGSGCPKSEMWVCKLVVQKSQWCR